MTFDNNVAFHHSLKNKQKKGLYLAGYGLQGSLELRSNKALNVDSATTLI